jgi:uncharacterized membrane protein
MRIGQTLDSVATRVERATVLDRPAATVQRWLVKAIPDGPVADLLRGKPLGHPIHPAIVAVPLGAWASATVFDLVGDGGGARRLIAVGCVAALPAALTGGTDWRSTGGAQRRVGIVHAVANDAALTCYTLSWWARRRGRRGRGVRLSLAGLSLVSVGGWLGGHLAFSQGVGVDTSNYVDRHPAGHPDQTA